MNSVISEAVYNFAPAWCRQSLEKGCLPENIIFLHLPKTAGFTLKTLMQKVFGLQRSWIDLHLFPDAQKVLIRSVGQIPPPRIFEGHFPIGLHNSLPGQSLYLTLFREPVSRTISQLKHIQRHKKHPFHSYVHSREAITELLTIIKPVELNNTQTRLLAGGPFFDTKNSDPEMLEIAQQNLQNHFIFGFMESFLTSINIFGLLLWFNFPQVESLNKSPASQKEDLFQDKDIQNHIRSGVEFDLMFYKNALEMFNRKKDYLVKQIHSLPGVEAQEHLKYGLQINGQPIRQQEIIVDKYSDHLYFRGWAFDSKNERVPDMVLVKTEQGTFPALGKIQRRDMADAFQKLAALFSGFELELSLKDLAGSEKLVFEFVFDQQVQTISFAVSEKTIKSKNTLRIVRDKLKFF